MTYTSTKTFDCVSTAHRNWRAATNPNRDSRKCAYIHGYTKTFTFVFGCTELDRHEWVEDYSTSSKDGKKRTMTQIKEFIKDELDHGVTTDNQDPMLSKLVELHELELIKLIVIPVENGQSGSVEGLCRYLYNRFDPLLREESNGRAWIESVTISEHHLNSSTYTRPQQEERRAFYINIDEHEQQKAADRIDLTEKIQELSGKYFNEEWIKRNFGNIDVSELYPKSIPTNLNDLVKQGFGLADAIKIIEGLSQPDGKEGTQPFKMPTADQIKSLVDLVQSALPKVEVKVDQTQSKPISAEDYLNKFLTKDNIELGKTLLKLHPKAQVASAAIDVGTKVNELIKNNPQVLASVAKAFLKNNK